MLSDTLPVSLISITKNSSRPSWKPDAFGWLVLIQLNINCTQRCFYYAQIWKHSGYNMPVGYTRLKVNIMISDAIPAHHKPPCLVDIKSHKNHIMQVIYHVIDAKFKRIHTGILFALPPQCVQGVMGIALLCELFSSGRYAIVGGLWWCLVANQIREQTVDLPVKRETLLTVILMIVALQE